MVFELSKNYLVKMFIILCEIKFYEYYYHKGVFSWSTHINPSFVILRFCKIETHISLYISNIRNILQSSCKLFFWLKLRIRIWVFINKYLFARISALNSCCISWVANLANLNFYISPVCEACFNSFYPVPQPKIHSLQPEMLQEIILWIWTKRKDN